MNKVSLASGFLLFLPLVASAQNFQNYLVNFATFLGNIVIPFLFGVAFLFFLINVIRYFVIGGSNEEGQEKAKYLAIYGISAFVFLIIFWGIINLLVSSLGFGGVSQPCPDYIFQQLGSCP